MTLESLQKEWTELYRAQLPALAREKHSAKSGASGSAKWPVSLDHCFARIILDNAVGVSKPWTEVVEAPATKNMTETQLWQAIDLGNRIADGKADLWALDEKSLTLRGKQLKSGTKRKWEAEEQVDVTTNSTIEHKSGTETLKQEENDATPDEPKSMAPANKSRKQEMIQIWSTFSPSTIKATKQEDEDSLIEARKLIAADANSTPFRKHVLTLLTQVPRGRYTTYQALSDAAVRLDQQKKQYKDESARGSARAIGGAMRNNPFAPTVPCHRVLASSGMLGGFGGSWGEDGQFAGEKKRLLREEGVKFDGKGKVVGEPFRGFYAYSRP